MKNLPLVLALFFSLTAYAQEAQTGFDGHKWEAPYDLPKPKDWGIERFLIPISFAPQVPYKGVEDIRFAPGWAKAASEEYWTYAFLWWLEEKPVMNAKIIEENLKNYYTGLLQVNSDSSKTAGEKYIPVVTAFKKIKTFKGDKATFEGTVTMKDYMKRTPITLHCVVQLAYCEEENRTVIFYQLSPKPRTHKNWAGLNRLWTGFKCIRTTKHE
ncbi:MAG: hypothetical protein QM791_06530 [Ferruginibacter sp.]